jgi:D-cysteine desulfhydrase
MLILNDDCRRDEELEVLLTVARETGVVVDPVNTGKALYGPLADMQRESEEWENSNRKVLFIHTGGLLGMYDEVDQLLPLVKKLDRSRRMPL